MKIKSNFAILDVLTKNGSEKIKKRIAIKGKIPVTITGFIEGEWSDFDGTSKEFEIAVTDVNITEAAE